MQRVTPHTSAAVGGEDDIDTSFDVSSDIILPNDSDDIITKGVKGDRTSSGSRGIPSNVSFYPDGTSSPQHQRLVKFSRTPLIAFPRYTNIHFNL